MKSLVLLISKIYGKKRGQTVTAGKLIYKKSFISFNEFLINFSTSDTGTDWSDK